MPDPICKAPIVRQLSESCGVLSGEKCDTGLLCTNVASGICVLPLAEGQSCGGATDICEFPLDCIDMFCAYNDYDFMCPAP